MKKILTFFVFGVMLFGSCRKEAKINTITSSLTSANRGTRPAISNAAISNWFAKNPIGHYITPDWSGARQAVIGGIAVVTVPVKSIALPDGQQLNGTKSNLKTQTTSSDNLAMANFDPYHPPALYFFQDVNGAYPDSVRGLLMNFVPDDPTKEDGANKIWTGKLMEWNMQTSKAYYQVLSKSMVTAKYMVDFAAPVQPQGVNIKVNSTIKTSSILGDIWDAIKYVTEAVGWFFGVPGEYHNYTEGTLG